MREIPENAMIGYQEKIPKVTDRMRYMEEMAEKKPHKCPVCDGNGSTKINDCTHGHAYEGKGIVWD